MLYFIEVEPIYATHVDRKRFHLIEIGSMVRNPLPFVAERAKEPPRQPDPAGRFEGRVYKRKAWAKASAPPPGRSFRRQDYFGTKIITIWRPSIEGSISTLAILRVSARTRSKSL